MQFVSTRRIVAPRAQVLGDQTLESGAVEFCGRIERPSGSIRSENASIKKIKLWMRSDFTLRALGEYAQAETEQQVFQDFQITFRRLAV